MHIKSDTIVYVVLNERFGMMKIGVTTDMHKRKRSLENGCGCKLDTLAITPKLSKYTAEIIERYLHTKYEQLRQVGEWFDYDPEAAEDVYSWHEKIAREGAPKLKGVRNTP